MINYKNILRGIKLNDYKSQMKFYDMFSAAMYRSAFAILGNACEAEEIMQDTMLKIFDSPNLLSADKKHAEKFLRRMSVNAAIDAARKKKNFIELKENVEDINAIDEQDDNLDEADVESIKRAISKLDTGYKTILTLRLFEEMEFEDIANKLEIAQPTARSQYSRALYKLRKILSEKQKNDDTV